MKSILIFLWIQAAMASLSFAEAYMEGRNAGDHGKVGWKFSLLKNWRFSAYHVWVFGIMLPLFLTLPLVIGGWNSHLFGLLLSAYIFGLVLEDFLWFLVNPVVSLRDWNSTFVDYYPWFRLGRFEFPVLYLVGIAASIGTWFLFRG